MSCGFLAKDLVFEWLDLMDLSVTISEGSLAAG